MGTSYTITQGYGFTFDPEVLYVAIPDVEDIEEWFEEHYPLLEPVMVGVYDWEYAAVSIKRMLSVHWNFTWQNRSLADGLPGDLEVDQLAECAEFLGLPRIFDHFGALSVG